MSFIINQNFALKSPQFNFARDYFANLADLKAASESDFPDHFITNVAGDLYQLTKSNSTSDSTGKWRLYKPSVAGNADSATKANTAVSATSATSATKATQDGNGRNIVDTYLTKTSASGTYATKTELDTKANKSDVSALTSALVYKGTIGTNGTITSLNVAAKVGDVYVAVAGAPAVNSVALEAGDMIIAKTAGDGTNTQPTWTAIQTNINGAVTTNNTELATNKLIIADGSKRIRTASGTGLVRIENGTVSWDANKYLTSVPKATTTAVGGGKVVNVHNATAELTNTVPTAPNVTLYGLQIDKDGNFFTPVKNAATYSLPTASDKVLGGIKTGFQQDDANHNYPVNVNASTSNAYVKVPLATYNILNDTDQKDGLITGAERKAINMLSLSGASVVNSGLQLTLSGVIGDNNGTVTIPFATSTMDNASYGLMKGSDKKKLDSITPIPDSEIIKLF